MLSLPGAYGQNARHGIAPAFFITAYDATTQTRTTLGAL